MRPKKLEELRLRRAMNSIKAEKPVEIKYVSSRLDTTEKVLEYFAGFGKSPGWKEAPHDFAWRMVKSRIAYAHMEPDILRMVLNNCALNEGERRRIREAIKFNEQFVVEEN